MPNENVVSLVQYDVNRFHDNGGPQEEWEIDSRIISSARSGMPR